MQHLLNRCAVLLKNIPNKVNQRCAAAKFQKNPPKESAWHEQLSRPGSSGMRNFIPVRYGTVFLQNPGIPVFFGTV